jgi:lipoprotein-anchoring transpeptidase ErfK/SrfK
MIRTFLIYLTILIIGILFFVSMIFFVVPKLQDSVLILPSASSSYAEKGDPGVQKESLQKEIDKLQSKLDKFTPTGGYFVVNTTENHFYLYKGKELIRQGVCSTGKNEKLIVEGRKKAYSFYTPFGVRTVQKKVPNPVWAKPDWAFIEDGMPIPPPGDPSRFESGTLGAYKLVLGDGYMIHGTIYKRFIGQSVTHGCIRLLDDDLEAVYKTMEIGSKVYIY